MTAPTFPIAIDKTVTAIAATSGVFTLTLSDVNGIQVGSHVDIGGLPTAAWNTMNEEVTAVNETANTIQYSHGNFTVAQQDVWAQVHIETTWASVTDVTNWLGFTPTGADYTQLESDVDAANDRCWYWRARAGYQDHPNVSPGSDVKQGVVQYAAILYRDRGSSGDTYAGFDGMGQFERPVSMARIMQLLGCKRPQVG